MPTKNRCIALAILQDMDMSRRIAPLVILLLTPWLGLGKDQPQWGEQFSRNMVSTETGLPDDFDPATKKNIRWIADLGTSCYSTPVIAKGKVFIGTNNHRPRDPRHRGDRGVLLCLDEATGNLLWQLIVPKLPKDPYLDCPGVGITSSAVVDEDRVYIVSNRGEVICLDINGMGNGNDGPFKDESQHSCPPGSDPQATDRLDADILWILDMPKEVQAYPHDSSNLSVLLHGPYLYVSTPNGVNFTHRHRPSPKAPGLIVLDKRTGKLLATDNTGIGDRVFHSTFSSPSLGWIKDRPLLFYGGADGICYAFNTLNPENSPNTPQLLETIWKFDSDPQAPKQDIHLYQGNRQISPSSIIGMPVFHNQKIYVAAGGDPWHGKRTVWLKCIDATLRGDITATGQIWSQPLDRHCLSTPSIHNGLVFIGDFGGKIHCFDAETGKTYWTHQADDELWGSFLATDNKLYAGSRGGELWILSAQKEKKLVRRIEFNEYINSSPVAANNTLYVTTMTRLYAIGSQTIRARTVSSP